MKLRLLLCFLAFGGNIWGTAPSTDEILSSVAPVCLAAKKPADLDALSAQLSIVSSTPARNARHLNVDSRLFAADRFVQVWRTYLAAQEREDGSAVRAALTGLLRSTDWVGFVPRSRVLARLASPHAFFWIDYPNDTLDDLPRALANFRRIYLAFAQDPNQDSNFTTLLDLQSLRAKLGTIPAAEIAAGCSKNPNLYLDLKRFQTMLLTCVLADDLQLDPPYHFPVEKGDQPLPYLGRVSALATEREDIATLKQVNAFARTLDFSPALFSEGRALDQCLAGMNFEKSGDRVSAIAQYLAVLDSPHGPAPIHFAQKRLIELSKNDAGLLDEAHRQIQLQQREQFRNQFFRSRFPRALPGQRPQFPPGDPRNTPGQLPRRAAPLPSSTPPPAK